MCRKCGGLSVSQEGCDINGHQKRHPPTTPFVDIDFSSAMLTIIMFALLGGHVYMVGGPVFFPGGLVYTAGGPVYFRRWYD